jgi:hypothetical protein
MLIACPRIAASGFYLDTNDANKMLRTHGLIVQVGAKCNGRLLATVFRALYDDNVIAFPCRKRLASLA